MPFLVHPKSYVARCRAESDQMCFLCFVCFRVFLYLVTTFYPCLCFACFCVFLAPQKVSLPCLFHLFRAFVWSLVLSSDSFQFLSCVLRVFVFFPVSFDSNVVACIFCVFVFFCLLLLVPSPLCFVCFRVFSLVRWFSEICQ